MMEFPLPRGRPTRHSLITIPYVLDELYKLFTLER